MPVLRTCAPRAAERISACLERHRRRHEQRARHATPAPPAGPPRPPAPRSARAPPARHVAAAWPLRTAPSSVAGQPCRRPGAREREPGQRGVRRRAQRRVPGDARNVAACSRVTRKRSTRASRARRQQLPQRRQVALAQRLGAHLHLAHRRPRARPRGTGARRRAGRRAAVEEVLHRRLDARGERLLADGAVVDTTCRFTIGELPSAREPPRAVGASSGSSSAAARSCGSATITASALSPSSTPPCTAKPRLRARQRLRAPAEPVPRRPPRPARARPGRR